MGVPSSHNSTSNVSSGVQFNRNPMNDYYNNNHRQPHYITDPKAYISGMATNPPIELDQDNIYTINAIRKYECYNENDSELNDSSDSSNSECYLCILQENTNSNSNSVEIKENGNSNTLITNTNTVNNINSHSSDSTL